MAAAAVFGVGPRRCRDDEAGRIRLGTEYFASRLLLPRPVLHVIVHVLKRRLCEQDVASRVGVEEDADHGNARVKIRPS